MKEELKDLLYKILCVAVITTLFMYPYYVIQKREVVGTYDAQIQVCIKSHKEHRWCGKFFCDVNVCDEYKNIIIKKPFYKYNWLFLKKKKK